MHPAGSGVHEHIATQVRMQADLHLCRGGRKSRIAELGHEEQSTAPRLTPPTAVMPWKAPVHVAQLSLHADGFAGKGELTKDCHARFELRGKAEICQDYFSMD